MRAVGLAVAGLVVLLLVLRPDLGRSNFAHMEPRYELAQKVQPREAVEPRAVVSRETVITDDVDVPPPRISE